MTPNLLLSSSPSSQDSKKNDGKQLVHFEKSDQKTSYETCRLKLRYSIPRFKADPQRQKANKVYCFRAKLPSQMPRFILRAYLYIFTTLLDAFSERTHGCCRLNFVNFAENL